MANCLTRCKLSYFVEGKKKKKTLINGKLRHVVEMAYWLVKFVGDYEKLASKSYKKEVGKRLEIQVQLFQ